MRSKFMILCVIVFVISVIVGGLKLVYMNEKNPRTTWYTFEVEEMPEFLTEEMAIAFARKALKLREFDDSMWEIRERTESRTVDPNGRTDKYCSRNALNPNRASMIFVNRSKNEQRGVIVEMEEKRIVCSVSVPK